jgi:hypothetical protein
MFIVQPSLFENNFYKVYPFLAKPAHTQATTLTGFKGDAFNWLGLVEVCS